MATLLIALIVLQFAGANWGGHQLHAGNSNDEAENHSHLQFSAEITTLAQCVDCTCSIEKTPADEPHQHLVSQTQVQQFDLCLDCQCHGGHVTLLSHFESQLALSVFDIAMSTEVRYFPPEAFPTYRPPIILS